MNKNGTRCILRHKNIVFFVQKIFVDSKTYTNNFVKVLVYAGLQDLVQVTVISLKDVLPFRVALADLFRVFLLEDVRGVEVKNSPNILGFESSIC